jgi:hypothetical protein
MRNVKIKSGFKKNTLAFQISIELAVFLGIRTKPPWIHGRFQVRAYFAQQLNSSLPKFKFMLVTLMVLDRTVHSTCELKLVSEAGHFKLEMAQWRATGGRHGHDDRDSHAGSGGRLASDTGDGPALPGDPSGFLTPTTSYVTLRYRTC